MLIRAWVAFVVGVTCACGDARREPDAAAHDAASRGGSDAESPSGTTDAGTTDSGTTDAGTIESGTTDSGTTDSGGSDAGDDDAGGDTGTPTVMHAFSITSAGNGTGAVTSSPAGIDCPGQCSLTAAEGTEITLTAQAGAGSTFTGWSGDGCTGTAPCVVTLAADTAVTATFTLEPYTLTVATAGTGAGTVTSDPAGIACVDDCSEDYLYGTEVTLTASPSAGSGFVGWSGGACTGTGPCDVTIAAATTVTATFELPNIVFVTSTTTTGDTDGIAGADAICNARASAAGLAGTYRAWLSTSSASAISRLGAAGGWVRPDGRPVANTAVDLAEDELFHPIRIDEFGTDVLEVAVHTATFPGGTLHPNSTTCDDYTTAGSDLLGGGLSSGTASLFTTYSSTACSTPARLYCFGIDRTVPLIITPPASYRRAFVTDSAWIPAGGVAAADALCALEASAAGLPGTYKALLATTTASAISRFTTIAPWARVDGVLITPTAAEFSSASYWDSTPSVSANGASHYGNYGTWGGASSLTATGTAASTCNDWSSASAGTTGSGGRIGMTRVTSAFALDSIISCSATWMKLTCLQE